MVSSSSSRGLVDIKGVCFRFSGSRYQSKEVGEVSKQASDDHRVGKPGN